jgi:phage terminase small subunit
MPRKKTNPIETIDDLFGDDRSEFTEKERQFILAYITDAKFVAGTAAKLAGYDAGSDNAFYVIGCNLMKKPRILNKINWIFESMVMPKFEVLFGLSQHARGSLADVCNDDGIPDLNLAKERGTDRLIQEWTVEEIVLESKTDAIEIPDDWNDPRATDEKSETKKDLIETSTIKRKTKVKIYSAQNAYMQLGRFHKVLNDRIDIRTPDGGSVGIESSGDGSVVLFLPDNGRGDSTLDAPAPVRRKRSKPKKTGKESRPARKRA